MGLRGPVPESASLRLLKGRRERPQTSSVTSSAAQTKPRPCPRCPAQLSDGAKAEWKRVAPELHRTGRLTALDVAALALYCQSYADYIESRDVVAREGLSITNARGAIVKHPLLSAARAFRQDAVVFGREFGLTPLSRGRMPMIEPDPEPDDAFEAWRIGSRT